MLGMLVVEWSESFATILHVRIRSINAISRRTYTLFGEYPYLYQGLLLVESKAKQRSLKDPQKIPPRRCLLKHCENFASHF